MKSHYSLAALAVLAALSLSAGAPAQTELSLSEQCGRPTAEYTIRAGDHPGHVFRIEQTACTPQGTVEIGGVSIKTHQATGFSEMDNGKGHDQWFHVFTMANGDSVYARSHGTADFEGLRFRSSAENWSFEGGTGKFRNLKGSGAYACQPGGGGYTCQAKGDYNL